MQIHERQVVNLLSRVKTAVLSGIDGSLVEVETDISRGIPCFTIVGLADMSIKESKERVRAAINNSGFSFPVKRITTNLSPANLKKEGSHLDLPIAIGLLKSLGIIRGSVSSYAFIGELSLSGDVLKIDGALPLVISLKEMGIKDALIPLGNMVEAGIVRGINLHPVKNLAEAVEHLDGKRPNEPITLQVHRKEEAFKHDFSDVKGQEGAKRALEIAASGMHNILILGPAGSGKTMLAKSLPSILPELSFDESLEITKIYSVAGLLKENSIVSERPFRSPHHTISQSALCGGGRVPKPGEISLAHRGVLFLDEFPEFQKSSIEALRQPLEDKAINISRVSGSTSYPSDVMLVAAMNPCRCGNYGTDAACSCTQAGIDRYLSRISAPILDRIDIHIEVARTSYSDLESRRKGESSNSIMERVKIAQEVQKYRYLNDGILFNSQLSTGQIDKHCELDAECSELMEKSFEELGMSARAYGKILKVARTIADLDGCEKINLPHLAEAIQYRALDRKYW